MLRAPLGEHLLDDSFVVRVGELRIAAYLVVLVDPLRIVRVVPVGSPRRRHDDLRNPCCQARFEDVAGAADVDRVLEFSIRLLARRYDRGEVHDHVDRVVTQDLDETGVAHIGVDERNTVDHSVRFPDVGTDDRLEAIRIGRKIRHEEAAQVTGSTRDEHRASHATASPGTARGRLDQNPARASPATMCHTPHHAAMSAIPPRPSKKVKTSTSASAEFCKPTSNVTARRSRNDNRAAVAEAKPRARARPLWRATMPTRKPM